MLKEIFHFLYHAPGTLALTRHLSHAELYDTLMVRGDQAGFAEWRHSLTADISGRVLEVGVGTGLMFPHYPGQVHLSALELNSEFLHLAKNRLSDSTAKIDLLLSDGATLPFTANAFDFVVFALVLCSVESVERVLAEVRRVLKPTGEVRLIEHVRSTGPISGFLMNLFNPLWLALNQQGCNMNRPTVELLQRSGFVITEVKLFKFFVPGVPAFPMRWIKCLPG